MSGRYANVSLLEIILIPFVQAHLSFVLAWTALKQIFASLTYYLATTKGPVRRRKTWRRVLGDTTFRFLSEHFSIEQFQYVLGTSQDVYEKWAKENAMPVTVEEIGEDARLFWIGPRRTEKVVLYFHGGGYLIPLSDFAVSFWNYARKELEKDGLEAGFAILNYSLVPTAAFPTQLAQATAALNHVLHTLDVSPANIQITGDSAGGNLVLALLSHLLRPLDLPNVPRLELSSPLNGVYMMSPWFCLDADINTLTKNGTDETDVVGARTYVECAKRVLGGSGTTRNGGGKGDGKDGIKVPSAAYPYLVATTAPETWFEGVEKVVHRVLVTAGQGECLGGETVKVSERIKKHHRGGEEAVKVIVQEGGVHNDPFFDFFGGETKEMCELTPVIIEWVKEGFRNSSG